MLLASYKQHKEIRTEKHNKIDKTQREKDNREEQRPKWAYKKLPTYKNNSEYSKCWNPIKEFLLIEQPSNPL